MINAGIKSSLSNSGSSRIVPIANIDRVSSLSIKHEAKILQFRVAGLENPWRELLGYKLGYLFTRIATEDVNEDMISNIIDAEYNDLINEATTSLIPQE